MSEYGFQGRVVEINAAAGVLARRLADQYSSSGHQRFVAGSIGPSGMLPSTDGLDLSDHKSDLAADIIEGIREVLWGYPTCHWKLFEILVELKIFPN